MNDVGSCPHMKASYWDEVVYDHLLITVHTTAVSGTKM